MSSPTRVRGWVTFRHSVKMLITLAFLPTGGVFTGFEVVAICFNLNNREIHIQAKRDFIIYFESTWIRGVAVTRPIFSPLLWSSYQVSLEKGPRTNNTVEGWNRGFLTTDGRKHSSFCKFLEAIRTKLSKDQFKQCQLSSGTVCGFLLSKYVLNYVYFKLYRSISCKKA